MTADMIGWRRMLRRSVECISLKQKEARMEAGLFVSLSIEFGEVRLVVFFF